MDIFTQIDGITDTQQLYALFQALRQRYAQLHPGEEVIFLCLPRDAPQERKRILQQVLLWEDKDREKRIATPLRFRK